MNDIPRVVLTGGVSGGHTFPLIAVARAIRKKNSSAELLFIGPRGRFEKEAMENEHIPIKYIAVGKWRRYFSLKNFIDPFKLLFGFVQTLWYLFLFMPDAVFAKGSAASAPVVIAAWLYRIPVLIHDSDAAAGKANRFLSHFASRVAIAYPSAHNFFPTNKTAMTGNPVRAEILTGDASRSAKRFGLSLEKPLVLVLGGSQGAQVLNRAALSILPSLLEKNIQVLHQTGRKNYEDVVDSVKEHGLKIGESGYTPWPFFSAEELADALSQATLVVSRAGAGSIAELAAASKAAILIPLMNAANDEQRLNAYDVAALGGALVLEEPNLGEHILFQKIDELLNDAELRKTMAVKLHSFYHPNAADAIADGVMSLMKKT